MSINRIERRIRWYQQPFHSYLLNTPAARAIEVAHRRWGKDEVVLSATCELAHKRIGSYWHCLPEYNQGRKAIWTALNGNTGKRRIDEAFPPEIRENTNDTEMFIRLKCGSTWQVIGSDRYDATVGAGPVGIAYSEWALANPSAWAYHRPMLEENGGWAAFITTPRGRNHAKAMYDMAVTNPRWFAETSTIRDTGALSPEQVEESLAEYIALYGEDVGRAQFEQEYYCSFNAAILGAFYAREMLALRNSGRIRVFDHWPDVPVHTAWDIGTRDDTSIWWFQVFAGQTWILDCHTASGAGVDVYAEICHNKDRQYGWTRGVDYVPHDAKVMEWGTGRTRIETMQGLELKPKLVPMAKKLDGVNAVRQMLPRCVFHTRTDATGIAALEQYRREWDDDRKAFRENEVHDWCFVGETEVVTRYGMCQIKSLPNQGDVLTPCGWKAYTNPRITRANAPLVEVVFADGLTVRCTPDHMFMTGSGWKSAESLTTGSSIQSCLTLSRSISMVVSIAFGRVKSIGQEAAKNCIGTFGQVLLGRSPKGVTSIIETAIRRITSCLTWNASRPASICLTHGVSALPEEMKGTAFSVRPPVIVPPNGIDQKRVGYGIDAMLSASKVGQNGSARPGLATIAVRYFKRLFERVGIPKGSAPKFARPRTIASVRHLNCRQDVWCLTVPGVEAFALSNGAVVHNCSHLSDAFRYLAMAAREQPASAPIAIAGYDPSGRPIQAKPLPKVLHDMSYDEFMKTKPKAGNSRV